MKPDTLAVIDNSVATHWFVQTDFSFSAREAVEGLTLIAPDLLRIELASSLMKYASLGLISKQNVATAVANIDGGFNELYDSKLLLELALTIAFDFNHKTYDCLYLALAGRENCELVTDDHRLAAIAGQLKMENSLVTPS